MNPYGIILDDKENAKALLSLNILYEMMPETTGCEDCEFHNGVNKDWCCKKQNPSMYYVEFMYVWPDVLKWSEDKRIQLILRAVRNYLQNKPHKGCIFYDNGCTIYENRPFACRMYGITPQENWEKRWNALKESQGEQFDGLHQCRLVSTKDGITVSAEREDKWLIAVAKREARFGVPPETILKHDDSGGSYRTFHDHLLIELFPEKFLSMLSLQRLNNPSDEDIDKTLDILKQQLESSK